MCNFFYLPPVATKFIVPSIYTTQLTLTKQNSLEFMNDSFLALPVGGATFRRVGRGYSKKLFINSIVLKIS